MNNLKPGKAFHELCEESEGNYLEAYPDPASALGKAVTRAKLHVTKYTQLPGWQKLSGAPWTIGIGHTGKVNGKPVGPGMTISKQMSYDLLDQDAAIAARAVNKSVVVPLNQNQFDALVDFTFNLGVGNFQSSTLLKKLNARDFAGAANEFPRWNKAQGQVLAGLTKRRNKEKELFLL